ncbi:kinase-like domain-containing protein [Earliella scabrosa]|nr:kinase-like domain-containing protein [Earliella scabrosa]
MASSDSAAIAAGLLSDLEVFWRDRYDWLLSVGYRLRPRYSPDWTPSWKKNNKSRLDCEDGVRPQTTKVMDAVRVNDDTIVMIKRISKSQHPLESEIGLHLSSPELSSDPRNHCGRILDVLADPYDKDIQLIVMPLLRAHYDPKLETVGEAVELFRQMFECLQFMHEHRVAHRDISKLNVMMDARPILPDLYHPQSPRMSRDFKRFVKPRSRTAHPVHYYLIDFGLSRRYNPEETNPLEVPIVGADKTVPEFQEDPVTPRNPFPTDVYYMGNFVRQYFLEEYSNLAFMDGLIAQMVQDEPSKRPTMDEVVTSFKNIVSSLSGCQLRERLVDRRDSRAVNFFKNVHHLSSRTVPFWIARRSPLPSPKA